MRFLSNAKSNQFLQKIIILNIPWLWKIKKVMAYAIKLTSYNNDFSVVNSVSNLSLIVNLLVQDTVFDY